MDRKVDEQMNLKKRCKFRFEEKNSYTANVNRKNCWLSGIWTRTFGNTSPGGDVKFPT